MQSSRVLSIKAIFMYVILIGSGTFIYSIDNTIDRPFDGISLKNMSDIKQKFGSPVLSTRFNNEKGETTFLFYEGIRFILFDNHGDSNYLVGFVLTNPKLEIYKGVRIGYSKDNVIKALGKPDVIENDRLVYRGNDHYTIFFIDNYLQVVSINWSFFVD